VDGQLIEEADPYARTPGLGVDAYTAAVLVVKARMPPG